MSSSMHLKVGATFTKVQKDRDVQFKSGTTANTKGIQEC